MSDLESKSLAQLHALAAEAGVERFRMMRREELIEALSDGAEGGEPQERPGDEQGSERGRRRRRRRGGRDRDGGEAHEEGATDEGAEGTGRERERERGRDRGRGAEETETVTGVIEIQSRGSGLLKVEGRDDAYVSPAQIRRCEIEDGDEVSGPVRPPRRGERRPSLIRVDTVNGAEPVDSRVEPKDGKEPRGERRGGRGEKGGSRRSRGGRSRGPAFEDLTPVVPSRSLPLKAVGVDILDSSLEMLKPLCFGHRVLVEARPGSARARYLRALAAAIKNGGADPSVAVLLIDERPEEVTEWRRAADGVEVHAAPADQGSREQIELAESTLEQAKRDAAGGADVVLIIDSLSRLSAAYGDAGRIKPYFGIGRELEEEGSGSLTVVATVLTGVPTEDTAVLQAVRTTENAFIRLDR